MFDLSKNLEIVIVVVLAVFAVFLILSMFARLYRKGRPA